MIRVIDNTDKSKGFSIFDENMHLGQKMAIGLCKDQSDQVDGIHFFMGVIGVDGKGLGIPMTFDEARAVMARVLLIMDRHEAGEI